MRISIFLISLFLFAASANAVSQTFRSITKDNVNVRSGPSTNHNVLFRVGHGYPIKVEQTKAGWIKFKDWEGDTGWVSEDFVGKTKTVVITKDMINVRSGPGTDKAAIRKVSRGDIYKVIKQQSGWIRVAYYDNNEPIGWIRQDLAWGY